MGLHSGGILLENPVISAVAQQLKPVEVLSVHDRFVILPLFDSPRYVYIDEDNKALPYYSRVYVGPGYIMPERSLHELSLTIPPVVRVTDTQTGTSQ